MFWILKLRKFVFQAKIVLWFFTVFHVPFLSKIIWIKYVRFCYYEKSWIVVAKKMVNYKENIHFISEVYFKMLGFANLWKNASIKDLLRTLKSTCWEQKKQMIKKYLSCFLCMNNGGVFYKYYNLVAKKFSCISLKNLEPYKKMTQQIFQNAVNSVCNCEQSAREYIDFF